MARQSARFGITVGSGIDHRQRRQSYRHERQRSDSHRRYIPDKSKSTGAAVVVAPGGALQALSIDTEGTRVADWLNSKGISGIRAEVSSSSTAAGTGPRRGPARAPREELKIVNGNANPVPGDAVLDEVLRMGIADAQAGIALVRKNATSGTSTPNASA